jgi:hypothetical protein
LWQNILGNTFVELISIQFGWAVRLQNNFQRAQGGYATPALIEVGSREFFKDYFKIHLNNIL